MNEYYTSPIPQDDKDSKRVNTENGVWMIHQRRGRPDIHLSVDYSDIDHNLKLGLGLIVPAIILYVVDDN